MPERFTKNVRLDPEHASLLRALAERRGTTESELLRLGPVLLGEREKRQRALAALIDMMRYGSPAREAFELR